MTPAIRTPLLLLVAILLTSPALAQPADTSANPPTHSPSGSASNSPAAPLSLAAFSTGSTILFQGDSITDAGRGRNPDPNHILGHGYAFLIAARHGAAFPDRNLNFINRGISGNTILDLQKRWKNDTLHLKPDLLSILVGINDARVGVSPDDYHRIYDELLTLARQQNPNLKIVLCEPFWLPVGKMTDDLKRQQAATALRQIVVTLAAKHDAALVPCQQIFTEACKQAPADYWIWDGVHPTYRGHQLLADAWQSAVQTKWGQ
jgi:lysophospholipase L1-like esterase